MPYSTLLDRALSRTFALRHWRMGVPRSNYKKVWNRLSFFWHDAKIGVSGEANENAIHVANAFTLDLLRKTVGIGPADTVLEIGAGIGRVGTALAPLCKTWIGADVSGHMVRHMKRRLAHLSNVRLVELSGYDLAPIASSSVDVVYCTVVFMHLEEWDRYNYVVESFRVLKPGGRLLVDNVNLLSDEGWAFFEAHRAVKPDRRAPSSSRTSTPQELYAYFSRAGFQHIAQCLEGTWTVTYGYKPPCPD